jgi:hypothetical protein
MGVSFAKADDLAAKRDRLQLSPKTSLSSSAQEAQVEERIRSAFSISPAPPPQHVQQAIRNAASSGRLTLSELPAAVSYEQTSSIGAETKQASPAPQAGTSAFDLLEADDRRRTWGMDRLSAWAPPDAEYGAWPGTTETHELPDDAVPLPRELRTVPTPRPASEQPVATPSRRAAATATADEPETAAASPSPIETAREDRLELPASLLPTLPTAD